MKLLGSTVLAVLVAGGSTAYGHDLNDVVLEAELAAEHRELEKRHLLASTETHVIALHQACSQGVDKEALHKDEAEFCSIVEETLLKRSFGGQKRLVPIRKTDIASADVSDPHPD